MYLGDEYAMPLIGASWITWLLTPRGYKYRIFLHMESQVYLEEGLGHGPVPGEEDDR